MREWPHPGSAKFFETSFPYFKTYFMQIGCCYLYNRQQFKTFDPINFTLSSGFSFQNAWPIKIEGVYTLLLFHVSIHFLDRIGSQFVYFLKLILF